jgi:predicted phosphodiesterase
MIVGICTDVHNHTARLRAFAAQARARGAEELWCLGDVVDSLIGAPPAAMAETVGVAVRQCTVVLGGNHELWALQRGLLDEETATTVEAWPTLGQRHGITVVHASLRDPVMEFITDAETAAATLRAQAGWLGVHGHTHRRRLWAQLPAFPYAESRPTRGVVTAAEDERLLACPGAITGGRPTWLRVETDARTLEWRVLR